MKLLFLTISLFLSPSLVRKPALDTSLQDYSIYTTTYEIGGTNQIGSQMISKYFDSNINIFKEDDLYFLSLTLLDNQALTDLNMSVSEFKSGVKEESSGKKTTYTMTLSKEDIQKEISLSGKVNKMGMNVSFSIKPNFDNLLLTDDKIDENIEFPARFVPELNLDGIGDIETTLNSYYKIPSSKASFNNQDLDVSVSVKAPSGEDVEINDGKIHVTELGLYSISFIASTNLYKTNLGNDSYAKETITLKSNASETSLVKVVDVNETLPKDYIVQCQRISSGSTYDKISSLLKDASSNFEVTNIELMNSTGETLTLEKDIQCYVQTNPNYDRNKVKVYHLEGDNLQFISSTSYGRYVRFEDKKMGTYVILVEGVTKSINLPLVISLSVIGVALIIFAIVFFVIFFIKKKKKLKSN